MKLCVHCNHRVSLGDRHALKNCPPVKGSNGHRRAQRRARQRRARRDAFAIPQRGVTVAGTGVPSKAAKK